MYPNRKHLLRDVVQRDIVLRGNFIFALKLENHNCHLLDILFYSVWLNLARSSRSQFVIIACEKIFRNYVEDMFWWPLFTPAPQRKVFKPFGMTYMFLKRCWLHCWSFKMSYNWCSPHNVIRIYIIYDKLMSDLLAFWIAIM